MRKTRTLLALVFMSAIAVGAGLAAEGSVQAATCPAASIASAGAQQAGLDATADASGAGQGAIAAASKRAGAAGVA